MYKLVIADDEFIIRKGLTEVIPWTDWNIEVVYVAKNGIQAKDFIKEHPTDFLLTDIKMPGLDGLDLIEACHTINPELKMIILSGHDEFDYAKRAMKLGVYDFLIKPTDPEELETAFKQLIEIKEKQQSEKLDLLNHKLKNFIQEEDLKNSELEDIENDLPPDYGVITLEGSFDENLSNVITLKEDLETHELLVYDISNYKMWEEVVVQISKQPLVKTIKASSLSKKAKHIPSLLSEAHAVRLEENNSVAFYRSNEHRLNIEKAILYVDNNYKERINQQEIAEYLHLSNSYFSRLFKQQTGMRFSDYLLKVRMDKAKYLLKTTDLKTFEIAYEVGFNEPQYFSQTFKKYLGITPKEYKASKLE